MTKVLLVIEQYVYTSFGISSTSYSGNNEVQAGTGQGYIILVNICRDSLYFVIKSIEEEEKGVIIMVPITKEVKEQLALSFVNDTNFISDGEDYTKKMKFI